MKYTLVVVLTLSGFLASCDNQSKEHGHSHAENDGQTESDDLEKEGDDHEHGEEVPLGTFKAGDLEIEASQAHEEVAAGKEGHLVIKLPYNDKGESVVRAWIGTEDRTLSSVGKGVYAPSHDDYDIHTMAPDPLPENVSWWVEIEKPDGTKLIGSIEPKL